VKELIDLLPTFGLHVVQQTLGSSDQAATLWSALTWQRFGRLRPVAARALKADVECAAPGRRGPKRRQVAALQRVEHLIRGSFSLSNIEPHFKRENCF
jgi:hypothetical protein